MKKELQKFMNSNPNEIQIEIYYVNKILPFDSRSIDEILND